MKYPRQIYVVKRPSITLACDMRLFLPDGDMPMTMHAGYSVFSIALLTHNEGKLVNPRVNIPVKDLNFLCQKTEWCNQQLWSYMHQPIWLKNIEKPIQKITGWLKNALKITEGGCNTNSPAFTQKLAGKFANKTVVEVIKEKKEAGIEELKTHANWLAQNTEPKYKKGNDAQIAAIKDGIFLYESGQLNDVEVDESSSNFVVYDSGKKFFRGEKKDGLNKCYYIKVTFNETLNYPYTVYIQNSYNSVTEQVDKTVRIGTENLYPQTAIMKLSASEWTGLITTMKDRCFQFELSNFARQYRIMEDNAWKPEEQYRA